MFSHTLSELRIVCIRLNSVEIIIIMLTHNSSIFLRFYYGIDRIVLRHLKSFVNQFQPFYKIDVFDYPYFL